MTSVSAGHIILTPTQPVGSGRPQRVSNSGPPHQESRALPQSYRAPQRETEREERDRERKERQTDRKRQLEREERDTHRQRVTVRERQRDRETER